MLLHTTCYYCSDSCWVQGTHDIGHHDRISILKLNLAKKSDNCLEAKQT